MALFLVFFMNTSPINPDILTHIGIEDEGRWMTLYNPDHPWVSWVFLDNPEQFGYDRLYNSPGELNFLVGFLKGNGKLQADEYGELDFTPDKTVVIYMGPEDNPCNMSVNGGGLGEEIPLKCPIWLRDGAMLLDECIE